MSPPVETYASVFARIKLNLPKMVIAVSIYDNESVTEGNLYIEIFKSIHKQRNASPQKKITLSNFHVSILL